MTHRSSFRFVAALCAAWTFSIAGTADAQSCAELVENGNFNNECTSWESGGSECESNPENIYLGTNPGNNVAEIDIGDGDGMPPKTLTQTITGLVIGKTYSLSISATRRNTGCSPPNPIDADVTLTGTNLGTHTVTRSGVSGAFTDDVLSVTATATSATLTIVPGANNTIGCGFILDNVSLTAICDDGLGCTTDSCASGTCQAVVATGCAIDGMCIAEGDANPANDCQVCDSETSTSDWSEKAGGAACTDGGDAGKCAGNVGVRACCTGCWDGSTCQVGTALAACGEAGNVCASCDDTNGCTDDACTAQACVNTNNTDNCNDGDACTVTDKCGGGSCQGTAKNCSDSLGCTTDSCDVAGTCQHAVATGCAIDNQCIASGTENPDNQCEACRPGISTTGWSNKNDNTACDDDNACTLTDTCSSGICTGGNVKDCGDGLACTGDHCNVNSGACTHSVSTGCLIDGTCHALGALNDAVECQYCDPSESETEWSVAAPGDDGGVCQIPDAGVADAGPDAATDASVDGDASIDDAGESDAAADGSTKDAGNLPTGGGIAGGGGLCAVDTHAASHGYLSWFFLVSAALVMSARRRRR